jgi:hypothetical protein
MPSDFVIFARPRTGSMSLMSRLDSCPDVVCHGEIFKTRRIDMRRDYRPRLPVATVRERNADPTGFVAGIRALDPDRHVGFKIFPPHLELAPGAIAHILAPATRRIVLTRTPLETYASGLRMRDTGVHRLREGETAEAVKARFTRKSFTSFVRAYNRYMAMCHMLAALPGSFVIDYSQINDEGALDALFAFVGSTARAAGSSTAYRKQHAGSLEDGFENWDDMARFMQRRPPVLLAAPPPTWAG